MNALIAAAAVRSYSPASRSAACAHDHEHVPARAPRRSPSPAARGRVDEPPQKADRDRLDALLEELCRPPPGLVLVELEDDIALPVDSLRDLLMRCGGTIGSGLLWRETCSSCSIGRPAERPYGAHHEQVSPWPRVVIRPVRAPRHLHEHVGADRRAVQQQLGLTEKLVELQCRASVAASVTASMKPSANSGGVEETFASVSAWSSSMTTQSVNVPPMSTPQ